MESANAEMEDRTVLSEETPRAALEDRDLLRRLLAEVSVIRKENQQLKSQALFISSYGVAYTIYLLFIYGVVYRTPQKKKKKMLSRLSSKSRDLLSHVISSFLQMLR